MTRRLRRTASTRHDRTLAAAAGTQYGEFAGWLQQDLGDTVAARYWSDRASQWAQAADDHAMVACLMIRKSNIALLDKRSREVIELAAGARKVPARVKIDECYDVRVGEPAACHPL